MRRVDGEAAALETERHLRCLLCMWRLARCSVSMLTVSDRWHDGNDR
jgi:hypothetical protein